MEPKIGRLKTYLKDPEKAIKDNYSLLVALQEILHMREYEPENTRYDRDIHELFYATISLFLQPIAGGTFSRWDQIRPAFRDLPLLRDDKIIRFEGFEGKIERTYELWGHFQSHLRIDKATVIYQRKREAKCTTLQKICDSYIMVSFPYEYAVTYEEYVRNSGETALGEEPPVGPSPVPPLDTAFDFDKLKEYIAFPIKKEPECGGQSEFERLRADMQIKCKGYESKQYAALALLLHGSTYLITSVKGWPFAKWLRIFYDICGLEKKPQYKPNQLKKEKEKVGRVFYYLLTP